MKYFIYFWDGHSWYPSGNSSANRANGLTDLNAAYRLLPQFEAKNIPLKYAVIEEGTDPNTIPPP